MKKNTKKSTTKKLVNTVARNKAAKPKKLVGTVVKSNKAAKIKKLKIVATANAFKRALAHANKMITSGNSFYMKELSMKEFKREYEQFGKRTGMLKGKNLDKNLKTFLANQISNRTPKQCESAANNLMKHLNDAVNALNGSKDGIKSLSDTNQRYIRVLTKADALKTNDKTNVYSIVEEKVPNEEDLLTVSNKYLNFKRILVEYFGDKEYAESYGS